MIAGAHAAYPELSIRALCAAVGAGRTWWCTRPTIDGPAERATALRDAIERIVLEFPGYGYRRVTKALQRDAWEINHKRALRVMREEALLCQLERRFVRTTDSAHALRTYPNLLAALDQALTKRRPAPGLIHHADRGVQYASAVYIARLHQAGAHVSMSAVGNPYDNAKAESFFKTLKREEVYLNNYQTFHDAEENLGRFIRDVYHAKRLHSRLGYLSPIEFQHDYFSQA